MNLQTLKQKTKLGNSGFSLVELIIVIAIMAILIAVLAPMFIRYVERSRISRDTQAMAQFAQTFKTIASDPVLNPSGSLMVQWTGNTGALAFQGDMTATNFRSAFNATIPGANSNFISAVSTTFRAGAVGISVDPGTGQVITNLTGVTAGASANADYLISLVSDIR